MEVIYVTYDLTPVPKIVNGYTFISYDCKKDRNSLIWIYIAYNYNM